jgi:hypothetical protein
LPSYSDNKDVDALRKMLAIVYDAAIQAQLMTISAHRCANAPTGATIQRNETRRRGLNTRAASIDLQVQRAGLRFAGATLARGWIFLTAIFGGNPQLPLSLFSGPIPHKLSAK